MVKIIGSCFGKRFGYIALVLFRWSSSRPPCYRALLEVVKVKCSYWFRPYTLTVAECEDNHNNIESSFWAMECMSSKLGSY